MSLTYATPPPDDDAQGHTSSSLPITLALGPDGEPTGLRAGDVLQVGVLSSKWGDVRVNGIEFINAMRCRANPFQIQTTNVKLRAILTHIFSTARLTHRQVADPMWRSIRQASLTSGCFMLIDKYADLLQRRPADTDVGWLERLDVVMHGFALELARHQTITPAAVPIPACRHGLEAEVLAFAILASLLPDSGHRIFAHVGSIYDVNEGRMTSASPDALCYDLAHECVVNIELKCSYLLLFPADDPTIGKLRCSTVSAAEKVLIAEGMLMAFNKRRAVFEPTYTPTRVVDQDPLASTDQLKCRVSVNSREARKRAATRYKCRGRQLLGTVHFFAADDNGVLERTVTAQMTRSFVLKAFSQYHKQVQLQHYILNSFVKVGWTNIAFMATTVAPPDTVLDIGGVHYPAAMVPLFMVVLPVFISRDTWEVMYGPLANLSRAAAVTTGLQSTTPLIDMIVGRGIRGRTLVPPVTAIDLLNADLATILAPSRRSSDNDDDDDDDDDPPVPPAPRSSRRKRKVGG